MLTPEALVGRNHARIEPTAPILRATYVPPEHWTTIPMVRLLENVREIPTAQQQRLGVGAAEEKSPRPVSQVFVAGDLTLLQNPRVAIVGTRKVSRDGAARTKRLAEELVSANVVVVSGLAEGVDTAAHTAAINAGGRTIAVIGTPLDAAFPSSNRLLQEKIYRDHLLVSQFPHGQRVFPSNFPQRNKVMAAMTDATIIIEASDTSGTLHQAAECRRLGRWLFIARSVAEDSRLTWPKRFLNQPFTRVLTQTEDVLRAICGGAV